MIDALSQAAPAPRRGGPNPDLTPAAMLEEAGRASARPAESSGLRLLSVRSEAGRQYAGYVLPLAATADRLPRLLRVLRGLSEAR